MIPGHEHTSGRPASLFPAEVRLLGVLLSDRLRDGGAAFVPELRMAASTDLVGLSVKVESPSLRPGR
jgi:hypothetical protein